MGIVIRVPFGRARARELFDQADKIDEDPSRLGEAEELYRKSIQLDPEFACAYANLGRVRYNLGDHKEAEQLFTRATEIDRNAYEAYYNLGYIAASKSCHYRAIQFFKRALSINANMVDAHYWLAICLRVVGNGKEAIRHWSRVTMLAPESEWATHARIEIQSQK